MNTAEILGGRVETKLEDSAIAAELFSRAEMERRFGYQAGAGLFESSLLERAGHYSEAVFSAYKDIAYARSYGSIDQRVIEDRLEAVLASGSALGEETMKSISRAVRAIRAFNLKSWEDCISLMEISFLSDSFSSWMLLAAQIQLSPQDQALLNAYANIQARYVNFPEYWYFSMLHERNKDLARDAAERCIQLAPDGPRALEARNVIVLSYNLDQKDSVSLLIVPEIESIATNSIVQGNPEVLRGLFPVLALPDNPSTLYALGVIKGLCDNAPVREWVRAEAKKADTRLAERLRYAGGSL